MGLEPISAARQPFLSSRECQSTVGIEPTTGPPDARIELAYCPFLPPTTKMAVRTGLEPAQGINLNWVATSSNTKLWLPHRGSI